MHQPINISVVVGLAVGLSCGLFNGLVITKLGLNSFVVTLATSFVYGGLINGISKGYPYINMPEGISIMGRGGIGFVPFLIMFAVIFLVFVAYFFKFTITGREVLATGGNAEAAKMSAVNTNAKIVLANVASGMFAAIAGLLWISRTASAQPGAGADWMLISFAVAVIGGTSLKGGVVNPVGIFFSSYLIVMVKNGLVMLDANIYFEQVYLGLILLLAVSVESIRNIIDKRRLSRQLKNAQSASKA
jgi:ribose transport system permease protein